MPVNSPEGHSANCLICSGVWNFVLSSFGCIFWVFAIYGKKSGIWTVLFDYCHYLSSETIHVISCFRSRKRELVVKEFKPKKRKRRTLSIDSDENDDDMESLSRDEELALQIMNSNRWVSNSVIVYFYVVEFSQKNNTSFVFYSLWFSIHSWWFLCVPRTVLFNSHIS